MNWGKLKRIGSVFKITTNESKLRSNFLMYTLCYYTVCFYCFFYFIQVRLDHTSDENFASQKSMFILYNYARLCKIEEHFQERVHRSKCMFATCTIDAAKKWVLWRGQKASCIILAEEIFTVSRFFLSRGCRLNRISRAIFSGFHGFVKNNSLRLISLRSMVAEKNNFST